MKYTKNGNVRHISFKLPQRESSLTKSEKLYELYDWIISIYFYVIEIRKK